MAKSFWVQDHFEYKINTQKPFAFLHESEVLSENKIKGKVPTAIACIRIKYLGINLTKEVKDLYTESYNIAERN